MSIAHKTAPESAVACTRAPESSVKMRPSATIGSVASLRRRSCPWPIGTCQSKRGSALSAGCDGRAPFSPCRWLQSRLICWGGSAIDSARSGASGAPPKGARMSSLSPGSGRSRLQACRKRSDPAPKSAARRERPSAQGDRVRGVRLRITDFILWLREAHHLRVQRSSKPSTTHQFGAPASFERAPRRRRSSVKRARVFAVNPASCRSADSVCSAPA